MRGHGSSEGEGGYASMAAGGDFRVPGWVSSNGKAWGSAGMGRGRGDAPGAQMDPHIAFQTQTCAYNPTTAHASTRGRACSALSRESTCRVRACVQLAWTAR
eukprot:scaffold1449_cov324-Prasinococcus_capsulatus_cf.AAC.16